MSSQRKCPKSFRLPERFWYDGCRFYGRGKCAAVSASA